MAKSALQMLKRWWEGMDGATNTFDFDDILPSFFVMFQNIGENVYTFDFKFGSSLL